MVFLFNIERIFAKFKQKLRNYNVKQVKAWQKKKNKILIIVQCTDFDFRCISKIPAYKLTEIIF